MSTEEVGHLEQELKTLRLRLQQVEDENTRIYGLLALAHLNLRQHLEYGFDPRTARSTLISVGQYYPKLKVEMEKNHAS